MSADSIAKERLKSYTKRLRHRQISLYININDSNPSIIELFSFHKKLCRDLFRYVNPRISRKETVKNFLRDVIYEIETDKNSGIYSKVKQTFPILPYSAFLLIESIDDILDNIVNILEEENIEEENTEEENIEEENIDPQYQIIIITALYEEYKAIKRIMDANQADNDDIDLFPRLSSCNCDITIGSKTYKVLLCCTNLMGMVVSSTFTSHILNKYQTSLKLIAMCGIAAGTAGSNKEGDIMIADLLWDYGSGKYTVNEAGEEVFLPYRYPVQLDEKLIRKIIELKENEELTENFRNDFIENHLSTDEERRKSIGLFDRSPQIHIGPFASGAGVVASSKMLNKIKVQEGKLIGFDMEAYGVAFAWKHLSVGNPTTKCIILKSVSDKGDEKKGDSKNLKQKYAAFTSAKLLYALIHKHGEIFGLD